MTAKKLNSSVFQDHGSWKLEAHQDVERIAELHLSKPLLDKFFALSDLFALKKLEYSPLFRFELAKAWSELFAEDIKAALRDVLTNRAIAGFSFHTNLPQDQDNLEKVVKLMTAIVHNGGNSKMDRMSSKYYAAIDVKHKEEYDNAMSYPYDRLGLHTDGTFDDGQTQWIGMGKITEHHATGGESTIIHLDSWRDFVKFNNHRLAKQAFLYEGASVHNVKISFEKSIFFDSAHGTSVAFNPIRVCPRNQEEVDYLIGMAESLNGAKNIQRFKLQPGEILILNNQLWLHGRDAFDVNKDLSRRLIRMRGNFID